ncbi:tannase and feruloyl esterase [Whalleya microplaca]|nr:tannase and feruloyl esterase [Whalleya microplaca]
MYFPLDVFLMMLAGPAATVAQCTVDRFAAMLADNVDATITLAQAIPRHGSFGTPEADPSYPDNATDLPALCAVSINVKSSTSSSYNFGLFLPDMTWNDRFLTVGNGGFGGGINWADMGRISQYGFATMSTDTGHLSEMTDLSWALHAPESIIDWAHRAMHGSVVLAKQIVNTYYDISDGIKFSYYAGCSTGGRQGLKEIQMYPDSFDGICVGAPAWWTPHLAADSTWQGLYNLPADDPKHVDSSLFPLIVAEMEKQCDPQDGVVDGIIHDPYGCNFDFEALLCTPGAKSGTCLTPEQLPTVYKFYNDWVDTNQTLVFPGITLGSDASDLLSSPTPLGYGFFQNFVHNDSEWDIAQFTYKDVQLADFINPGNATADNFDLGPFMERGGKILKYHGSSDSLIPTGSSIYFYNQVRRSLVSKGVDLDDFYRFFLIPGMGHCSGSARAPWYISAGSQPINGTTHSVPGFEDANHDIILAMMKWVEDGKAPEQLIATKYVNDTTTLGIQRQRPLCVYPKQAKHISGDIDVSSSWECKALY